MDIRTALKAAGVSNLDLQPGDVCVVKDESVVIPETPEDKRKVHPEGRTCIVLTTSQLSKRPAFPIISIAPTSSKLHLKEMSDYELGANEGNGLDKDSLVMIAHIQPVRKADLIKKIGKLSESEWDGLSAHLLWYFELDP